jgi:O-acetylserine/cysteine efflux transporter
MTAVAPRDLLLLIGVMVISGLNLVISKIGVSQMPPILFTLLRFAAAALLLAPFLKRVRGQKGALLVACLLAGCVSIALVLVGLAQSPLVSSVAIASQLIVPFTTLLSIALLGERVHWRRWTGISMAFAGVMIVGFDPRILANGKGLLAVIASALAGALGLIAIKRLRGFSALEIQAWIHWSGLPVLLVIAFACGQLDLSVLRHVSAGGWGALAFAVLAASIAANTGLYYFVQRYQVTNVAPLTVLSPLVAIAFGAVFLGDEITSRIVAGGVLTLAGMVIITWREKRVTETGS